MGSKACIYTYIYIRVYVCVCVCFTVCLQVFKMPTFGPKTQPGTTERKYRNVRFPYHVGITTDGARVCMCLRTCVL